MMNYTTGRPANQTAETAIHTNEPMPASDGLDAMERRPFAAPALRLRGNLNTITGTEGAWSAFAAAS